MAIGYWGYPNGDIPTDAMKPIESRGGTFWLEPSAQFWWLQLAAEYQQAWGTSLEITDAYRNLAEQQYYWDAWLAGWGNVAARPGKSNHGWAMAVDIYTPSYGGSSSTAQHAWLRRWAPGYGWTWTTGQASGESWHWEFTDVPTVPAGDSGASIEEEEEEMAYAILYHITKGASGSKETYRSGKDYGSGVLEHRTYNDQWFIQTDPNGPLLWVEFSGVPGALSAKLPVIHRTGAELRDREIARYGHQPQVGGPVIFA